MTFKSFVNGIWKVSCFSRYKKTTQRRTLSLLNTQLIPTFGPYRLQDITGKLVHLWFDEYSKVGPAGANRALDILNQIMNYAISAEFISGPNPCKYVQRNKSIKRTRFLSMEEVQRLHAVLNEHAGRGSGFQQVCIFKLLLYTGCRKSEIVYLKWKEINGDVINLTDSKTGPRTVVLTAAAKEVLEKVKDNTKTRYRTQWVFPNLEEPIFPRSEELSLWKKIRWKARLRDVRIHDLRHTFASHAVMQGTPLPVVSKLLGHTSQRMTFRYAHIGDLETRQAVDRIGGKINNLLNGEIDE